MVGILVSFWDGLFSGAMLASGSVVFQKILQSYLVKRCLEPLKAEPQEVFGSLSTDPRNVIFSEHQGYAVYRFQWVSVENMTRPHPKSLVRGKRVWMLDFLNVELSSFSLDFQGLHSLKARTALYKNAGMWLFFHFEGVIFRLQQSGPLPVAV